MYISKIDGKLNSDVLIQRDSVINANTFVYLGRKNYTADNIEKINRIKERQAEFFQE